jgi:hypothetical protein
VPSLGSVGELIFQNAKVGSQHPLVTLRVQGLEVSTLHFETRLGQELLDVTLHLLGLGSFELLGWGCFFGSPLATEHSADSIRIEEQVMATARLFEKVLDLSELVLVNRDQAALPSLGLKPDRSGALPFLGNSP